MCAGLSGARGVYSKYRNKSPFFDSFYSMMCLLELFGSSDDVAASSAAKEHASSTTIVLDTRGDNTAGSRSNASLDSDSCSSFDDAEVLDSIELDVETTAADTSVNQEDDDEDMFVASKLCLSTSPDVERVRGVFEDALLHNKGKHHGMILILF